MCLDAQYVSYWYFFFCIDYFVIAHFYILLVQFPNFYIKITFAVIYGHLNLIFKITINLRLINIININLKLMLIFNTVQNQFRVFKIINFLFYFISNNLYLLLVVL